MGLELLHSIWGNWSRFPIAGKVLCVRPCGPKVALRANFPSQSRMPSRIDENSPYFVVQRILDLASGVNFACGDKRAKRIQRSDLPGSADQTNRNPDFSDAKSFVAGQFQRSAVSGTLHLIFPGKLSQAEEQH